MCPTPFFSIRFSLKVGQCERGIANKGDEVEIIGSGNKLKTTITGIGESVLFAIHCFTHGMAEMFRKELDRVGHPIYLVLSWN